MYLINKGNNTQLLHYKNHISLLTILHNTFINQAVIQINKSIIIYNMQKAHHSSLPPSLTPLSFLSLPTSELSLYPTYWSRSSVVTVLHRSPILSSLSFFTPTHRRHKGVAAALEHSASNPDQKSN